MLRVANFGDILFCNRGDNMTTENNFVIGKRISQARMAANLNKRELAERVHVAASTIGRYEDGTIKQISIPLIQSIATVLNVNPMWLLGKSECKETLEMVAKLAATAMFLSDDEQELLEIYQKLNDSGKKALLGAANALVVNPILSNDNSKTE